MDCLIVVNYRSVDTNQQDIQRKRIDYILQRFQKRGEDVEKIKHVVIHYKGNDVNSLLDELRVNINDPDSSIEAFSCKPLDNANDSLVTSFRSRVRYDYKKTEERFDRLLTRRLTTPLNREGSQRGMLIYKKKTRESQVEVTLFVMSAGEYAEIEMTVKGYGPLKTELCDEIQDELYFLEGKM